VLYSASNAKLKVNGNEIIASNASLSLGASLNPQYRMAGESTRNTAIYAPTNGIGGQLNFSYFITGKDYLKTFITGQGETGNMGEVISGNFGGLNFDSGYLTSYSANFGPNTSSVANVSISFFDQLNGVFSPTETQAPDSTQILNLRSAIIEGEFASDAGGNVDNFIGGAYNYTSQVRPVYLMGETKPSAIAYGEKVVNMNFEIDSPTGYLPVSGTSAKIKVSLLPFISSDVAFAVEDFVCSGLIQQRNIASAAGDYIKHSINIVQNDTQDSEVVIRKMADYLGIYMGVD
jgi:hypothetical protein